MSMIRCDSNEMASTATFLRSLAGELSTIGTDVRSQCCACCVPADIESEVLARAFDVESSLTGVAGDLGIQAGDIATRGAVAANDSLGTAASAASGSGSTVIVGGDVTIVVPPLPTAAPALGVSTIGGPGDSILLGSDVTIIVPPVTYTPTPMTISVIGGPGNALDGPGAFGGSAAANATAAAIDATNGGLNVGTIPMIQGVLHGRSPSAQGQVPLNTPGGSLGPLMHSPPDFSVPSLPSMQAGGYQGSAIDYNALHPNAYPHSYE